jgi:hypothetical protein
MIDTSQDIKALQLKIWLSKSPMERLRQMMLDNEALIRFWSNTHRSDTNHSRSKSVIQPPPSPFSDH